MEELPFANEPLYAVVVLLSQTVTCGHFNNQHWRKISAPHRSWP